MNTIVEMFALITMETDEGESCTVDVVFTVNGDTTRQQLFHSLVQKVAETYGQRFANAKVVHYTVEPNTLTS
jgi:hypothetical protein